MAQSLFQMATQGKNVAAAIFWMKARAGWREKHEIAHTAPNGPVMQILTGVPRPGELTEEQRLAPHGLPPVDDATTGALVDHSAED